MKPYFDLGFFQVPAYGLCVAIGIICYSILITRILGKKEGFNNDQIDKVLLISLMGFLILGASALVMNSVFHSIQDKCLQIGGFTWLGGVLIGFPLSVLLFEKLGKIKWFGLDNRRGIEIFEYIMPGIILAHGFGRIGCFLAGCCYGGPTDSFLGVRYPYLSEAYLDFPDKVLQKSLPLWPTQLFETAFEFVLCAILVIFRKKLKNYALEIYCFSYGVFRFLIEYLRADDRGSAGFLSPSQLMSILLMIYGVVLLILRRNEKHKDYFITE